MSARETDDAHGVGVVVELLVELMGVGVVLLVGVGVVLLVGVGVVELLLVGIGVVVGVKHGVCVWTTLNSPSPMRVPATTRTKYVPPSFGKLSIAMLSSKLHVSSATPNWHVTLATKQLKLVSVALYASTR